MFSIMREYHMYVFTIHKKKKNLTNKFMQCEL